MADCVVPHCARGALADYLFCKECKRLIKDDERYAMRMAARSPAYGPSAWPETDGKNLMWAWNKPGNDGNSTKDVEVASRALHWAEYQMVCEQIGRRIHRVHLRAKAKRRLRGPRGW